MTFLSVRLLALIPLLTPGEGFPARFDEIRAGATPEELYRFLWALPKGGDLHNHHEYSVPPEAWLEAALRGKVAYSTRVRLSGCGSGDSRRLQFLTLRRDSVERLPACVQRDYLPMAALDGRQRAAWISAQKLDLSGEGRDEFFERVADRLGDLENDPDLVTGLLLTQLRQAAEEGVAYLETQTDPRNFVREDGAPMPWPESAALYRRRLAESGARATGVAARLQVGVLRFSPDAERRLETAFQFVHQNRDLWVAVNLVGREDAAAGRAGRFAVAMRRLQGLYPDVRLSLHAGESESAGREVREAIALGAGRIGHGTNLFTDPETMGRMSGGPIPLEISLVSNHLLGYVPDVSRHPFARYLRAGIPVVLGTDDRGAFDSNIVDEYFLAVTRFGLTWPELVRMGRQSLEYSFAEDALKQRLLAEYDLRVAAFERRFDTPSWRARLLEVKPRVSGYARRFLKLSGRDMITPRNRYSGG